MTQRHSLIAFSLLLFAICYLATVAAVLAYMGKYAEALGFGGITTGLVGVIGTFRPKVDSPAGTPADPVSVKETEPQP
jgi:hypothetical protein